MGEGRRRDVFTILTKFKMLILYNFFGIALCFDGPEKLSPSLKDIVCLVLEQNQEGS